MLVSGCVGPWGYRVVVAGASAGNREAIWLILIIRLYVLQIYLKGSYNIITLVINTATSDAATGHHVPACPPATSWSFMRVCMCAQITCTLHCMRQQRTCCATGYRCSLMCSTLVSWQRSSAPTCRSVICLGQQTLRAQRVVNVKQAAYLPRSRLASALFAKCIRHTVGEQCELRELQKRIYSGIVFRHLTHLGYDHCLICEEAQFWDYLLLSSNSSLKVKKLNQ